METLEEILDDFTIDVSCCIVPGKGIDRITLRPDREIALKQLRDRESERQERILEHLADYYGLPVKEVKKIAGEKA